MAIPCGGWCPRGRRTEDGPLDPKYPLKETPSAEYAQRTQWNVRDSDGSLILTRGRVYGGTDLAVTSASEYSRPILIIDLNQPPGETTILRWLEREKIRSLGIGGPREESEPGIYQESVVFLRKLFTAFLEHLPKDVR